MSWRFVRASIAYLAMDGSSLNLTDREIAAAFSGDWTARFPPTMSIDQVAELLHVPRKTIYDWSHRGLLKGCGRKVGKRLLFFRDRLIKRVFNQGLNPELN